LVDDSETLTPGRLPAVALRGSKLSIDELVRVARLGERVEALSDAGDRERVERAYEAMQAAVRNNEIIYGVTTGFGGMANVLISPDERDALQDNMLWYHKAGAGRRLPSSDVRAAMLLRANSHMRGASGSRALLIERLVAFLNAGVTPHVYELGSIGASGDLVPLTYIAGALIGHEAGYQVEYKGQDIDARAALQELGLPPLKLDPKEALAMLNGTSVSTAIAAGCVHDARVLLRLSMCAHAFMLQGLHGTNLSFASFIHRHKPHSGQLQAAEVMRDLLRGSCLIREADGKQRNPEAGLVQDRYSLRCLPQFLGPIFETIQTVGQQIEVEMNSTTDNPLVDADTGDIYYCGNFLAQYVGVGMDQLRQSLGLLAKHLDVQIALLVSPEFSNGLAPSLVGNRERRVNMGLKGLQIVSNSIMPLICFMGNTFVDRFPTHAEQHNQNINSQAFGAANLARQSIALMRQMVSISLLFGMQAVDLRTHHMAGHYDARRLLSPALVPLYSALREVTGTPPSAERPWLFDDNQRTLDRDIAAVCENITSELEIVKLAPLSLN
jgi:phenylalanine ammonia-lyase